MATSTATIQGDVPSGPLTLTHKQKHNKHEVRQAVNNEGVATNKRLDKEQQAAITTLKHLLETDAKLYGAYTKLNGDTVIALLAYAQHIVNAREEFKGNGTYGVFDPWADFQAKCKGGAASVSKFIAVAEHKGINNPKYIQYLPSSLYTLYELTPMSLEDFDKTPMSLYDTDGTINPGMTRGKARAIAGKQPHPSQRPKSEPKLTASEKGELTKQFTEEEHLQAGEVLSDEQTDEPTDEQPETPTLKPHMAFTPTPAGTALVAANEADHMDAAECLAKMPQPADTNTLIVLPHESPATNNLACMRDGAGLEETVEPEPDGAPTSVQTVGTQDSDDVDTDNDVKIMPALRKKYNASRLEEVERKMYMVLRECGLRDVKVILTVYN